MFVYDAFMLIYSELWIIVQYNFLFWFFFLCTSPDDSVEW